LINNWLLFNVNWAIFKLYSWREGAYK